MIFMAAAPEGVTELDFEAEEVAILEATARLPVHLLVEESGGATFLHDRVAQEGLFDVVHLSCHGHLLAKEGPVWHSKRVRDFGLAEDWETIAAVPHAAIEAD